jgi:hypothetical protein
MRVVEIALLSVLAGALLPLVFQLRSTLRAAQRRLEGTADRLDRALEGASVAVDRLNRATEPLVDGRRVRELMEAVEGLARTVDQMRRSAQVASAVGAAVAPAVAAAVRTLRTPREEEPRVEMRGRPVRTSTDAA